MFNASALPSIGVVALGCMLACSPAQAASISVNPVRAVLSLKNPVAALTVHNSGSEPAIFQIEVMSWSQQQGKDVYVSTKELLASPPIFTVAAGGSQLLRVGLRRAVDSRQELSYRIYLQEVPPAPKAGFNGLQVTLRVGIPIFVSPLAAAASMLHWQAVAVAPGKVKIAVANSGSAHAQISNFQISAADGSSPLPVRQTGAYVMPGQSLAWIVDADLAQQSSLRLKAQTDTGTIETDLAVESQ